MSENQNRPFWEAKSLEEMSKEEWESLCDGCGKCCLVLLEDEETGDIWETDIACKLFDCTSRRCTDYDNRQKTVPGCVQLTPENISGLKWMPETCAYRLLDQGQPLPEWHPLVTGDPTSTLKAGQATPTTLFSEKKISKKNFESRSTQVRVRG